MSLLPLLGAFPATQIPISLSQWLPSMHSETFLRVHAAPLGTQWMGGTPHGEMSAVKVQKLCAPRGTGQTRGGLHSEVRLDVHGSLTSLQWMGLLGSAQNALQWAAKQQITRMRAKRDAVGAFMAGEKVYRCWCSGRCPKMPAIKGYKRRRKA